VTLRRATFAVLVWSIATAFLRLGAAPVYNNNEAREGVYVRAMLETGDWILPQTPNHVENGETIPDKPPLFHWISASVAWLRTAIATRSIPTRKAVSLGFDEWALRFPSAICGILMVMAIAVRGRRIVGERAALLAALTLVVTAQYVRQSQYGRVDMTMAAFVTLAILLLGEALLDGSATALVGAAAASGLATLAKGPVGLALPVVVGVTWIAIDCVPRRSLRSVIGLPWVTAGVVWLAIVVPWYVAAYEHAGMAFLRSQLVVENFRQYTGADDSMPWSYYVHPWSYMSFPWNAVGVIGVAVAWRARDRRAMFCATWWVVLLAFFQLSAYKRAHYLLPALPAGALMCGYCLDTLFPVAAESGMSPAALRRLWRVAVATSVVAAGLGAWILPAKGVLPAVVSLTALDGALAGLGLAAAAVALVPLVRSVRGQRWWPAFVSFWVLEAALFQGVVVTGQIAIARRCSPTSVIARLLDGLAPDAKLTLIGIGDDSTLPLLLYFPDPSRLVVVPEGSRLPRSFPPGRYVFGPKRWADVVRDEKGSSAGWHVDWTDDFGERNQPTRIVFVERS
jgi:4-amino-4-deoxy-L-arabinose transferase-like glycosyltransferase